eukprot:705862-Hanusia_phi.AAC.3
MRSSSSLAPCTAAQLSRLPPAAAQTGGGQLGFCSSLTDRQDCDVQHRRRPDAQRTRVRDDERDVPAGPGGGEPEVLLPPSLPSLLTLLLPASSGGSRTCWGRRRGWGSCSELH